MFMTEKNVYKVAGGASLVSSVLALIGLGIVVGVYKLIKTVYKALSSWLSSKPVPQEERVTPPKKEKGATKAA